MRRIAGVLVSALLVAGCSSSHASSTARREARIACAAIFGEVGPMEPSVHEAIAHLNKADRLDHSAFANMLAHARHLHRALQAGRLPDSKVQTARAVDTMNRDCHSIW